jgi:CBS domain-containing protein
MRRTVHAVSEHASVREAAGVMRELDIGFLPVVDDAGLLIGVVTDRDIVTRACALDEEMGARPVRRIMTDALVTCAPDADIAHAASEMRSRHVTRVPVVDALGRVVGIVSLSDLAQYDAPARVGRTLRTVAERKYGPERP